MRERALIALVKGYQRTLSAVFGGQCRFHPSCSDYAIQAIQDRGAIRGTLLAAWRVMRCGPWSAGGIDYPHRRTEGAGARG